MRALVIVNPKSTRSRAGLAETVRRVLFSAADCDSVVTRAAGQAAELAAHARSDGYDVVVTLGGDGTANEAVQGLLGEGIGDGVPALAPLPAGSGNVFARALGMPSDPIRAARAVADSLAAGRIRTVNLARADVGGAERWVTMSIGMGLDAEIIAAMDEQRSSGLTASPGRYFATTLRQYFRGTDRAEPAIAVELPGQAPVTGAFQAVVQNAAPYTYFGRWPVGPSSDASFDTDLYVWTIRDLRVLPSLRWTRRLLVGDRARSTDGFTVAADVARVTLTASRPVAVQLDGESLGALTRVEVVTVPQALRVIDPAR